MTPDIAALRAALERMWDAAPPTPARAERE